MAFRSTPRSASVSARLAIDPGSFFSWTTNWLGMRLSSGTGTTARSSHERPPSRQVNRFTSAPGNGYHAPDMTPLVRVPSVPAATFRLPPALEGLRRLAYNLYWSWHPRAKYLFNRIDAVAWTRYRNPIPVLAAQRQWDVLLEDPSFLAEYDDVMAEFDRYLAE